MNRRICLEILAILIPFTTVGATDISQAEQQEMAKKQWIQWEQRVGEKPSGFQQEISIGGKVKEIPVEANAFLIKEIDVESDVPHFKAYVEMLRPYEGYRIGAEGINQLAHILQDKLIAEGYTTTQVDVPPQDVSTGKLVLRIVPGRIEGIRFENAKEKKNIQAAFPVKSHDVLNVYDLEQGLDQMNRVGNQQVTMELVPGRLPDTTMVRLKKTTTQPVILGVSVDNSGSKTTGKYMASMNLSWYNPLGVNDVLSYSYSRDVDRKGALLGSHNYYASYWIPYGKDTLSFQQYRNHFHQTIASIQPYVSRGVTQGTSITWERVLHRNQKSKISSEVSIKKRERHNYIDGEEIDVQAQRTTALEYGIRQRLYRGQTQVDQYLFVRKGVGAWGAQKHSWEDGETYGTPRYTMLGLEWSLISPMHIGKRQGSYVLRFVGQTSKQKLYLADQISIGGRYTVRGFDGEETLSGESGFYLQQEWNMELDHGGWIPYVALDMGAVRGPSTENQVGRALIGSAIGIRGKVNSQLQIDVHWGTPIYKPKGFHTRKVTFAFALQGRI